MIKFASEQQAVSNGVHEDVAKLAEKMSFEKIPLSEKLTDAMSDLPFEAKAIGLVLAIIMLAKSQNAGKIIGGLALTGIAGEVLTRAMTDGDQGVIDFIQEKGSDLTGSAKEQISKMM